MYVNLQKYANCVILYVYGVVHTLFRLLEELNMKKRTFILLVIGALLMCSLTACSTTSNASDDAAAEMSNFKAIEGKEYLAYSIDTRVVYYMFSTSSDLGNTGYGYAYFAPYISENGNFCRYINDEVVEITVEDTNN